MNLAIYILGAILGLLLIGIGAFTGFAAGMSDAPAEADKAGKRSCATAIVGLAVLAGSVILIVKSIL